MKANELRIGNIVNYLYDGERKQGVVNQISKFKIIINNQPCKIKNIEPVIITKEWLLKFGFIKDPETIYRFFLKELFTYDLDDNCICIVDTWEFGKRKYVHELQNLYFALKGEEPTIK